MNRPAEPEQVRCPRCGGNGITLTMYPDTGEIEDIECPACEGEGHVSESRALEL